MKNYKVPISTTINKTWYREAVMKLKTLVIVVTTCIVTTGCYQSVNSWDIERAIKFCEGLDNVIKIEAAFNGIEAAQCKNKPEDAEILP